MTILDELKLAIMATKGKFCTDDFYHITTARGAHQSAVAKAFRQLRDDFCIKVAGHRGSEGPKRDLICYKGVKGAKFVVKERKETKPIKHKKVIEGVAKPHPNDHWWNKIIVDPQYIATCRIESAMAGWR